METRRSVLLIASLVLSLGISVFVTQDAVCFDASKKVNTSPSQKNGSPTKSPLSAKAWNALSGKNYRAAIKAADQWISSEPKAALAYFVKGQACKQLGEKEHAVEAFSRAIKLDSKLDAAYGERGWLHYSAGRYREAERDFSALVALTPTALAYTSRAQANEKLGNAKAVIADCTKVIQLNPKDLSSYELRANALFKTGPYDMCVEDWKKAIALDPKAERLRLGLGYALTKTYDHEAVVEEMTKAIDCGIRTIEVYKIRADAFYKQESYERCAEDLTVILTKFGTIERWKRWDYLKLRARAYLRNKEYAKSEKDSADALAIAPDDSKSYYSRADARQHLGKFKEAIQDLTQLIKYDPNDSKAFSMRAKIYEHIGQKANADSDRKTAIKLGEKQWGN